MKSKINQKMAFSGIKTFFGVKSETQKKEEAFENFSQNPDFKYLRILDMQHLGIPGNATKSLTFDSIQGLVAVGSMEGSIKM